MKFQTKIYRSRIAALSLLAAFSLPAVADGGLYLAADVGQAHFSGGVFDDELLPPSWTSNASDTATGYRFTAGYQFTPYWGVEAGYVDLGHGTVTYRTKPSTDPAVTTMVSYRVGANGFFAAGTGTWPIDQQWSLYARAGVISSKLDFQSHSNGISTSQGANATDTALKATYGVGAKWNFQPRWSLRLGWDHYRNLGNASYDVNLLSLGVEWHFF